MRMVFRRRGRPDPEAAERLLDAVAAGATGSRQAHGDVPDPLAHLLAVAAAPARPEELHGEDAAVTAFRAARDGRTTASTTPRTTETREALAGTATGPPAERRPLTAGALGWIAVTVATLTAGVALAAEIPALRPAGPPSGTPSADAGPSVVRTSAPPTTGPAPRPTPTGTEPPLAEPGRPGQAPPPQSLVAQCRAFLGGGGPDGSSARRPPSAVLVRAAGGRDEVDGYCRHLLATDPEPGANEPRRPPDKNAPAEPHRPPGRDAPTDPPGRTPGQEHGGKGSR
ncbi:hypothetical protein [Plantactinospora sp. KLBMP9567]|uniref:hypothetical protein n=1 Tax=Plantactinospora sp. KLBMP9567 TaxID=3085900 RepID=UPI002980FECC|nr:hypothetical protein [Plantactinospora sp. KLBMP9567]MDW5326490.1 hypothetical protein [Plantactinospora sp. KLBMP9567]